MPARIHATAIVDPASELADDVEVGPYAIIEGPVRVGAGTRIGAHAQIVGDTVLGPSNVVGRGAVIGEGPQDLRFDPSTKTGVRVGARNVLREHVTIHRATKPDTNTVIGDDNFIMVGCHVAHDCRLGNSNIFANAVLLAGHVQVESRVVIAGGVPIHQFARLGELCFIGGLSATAKDVPPFMALHGRGRITGVNVVGLRRASDVSPAARRRIRDAYATLYRSGLPFGAALARLDALEREDPCAEVRRIVDFCRDTRRGVCKGGRPQDLERASDDL